MQNFLLVQKSLRAKVSSYNFIVVQFYPLVQKYLRAILSPRANLTATRNLSIRLLVRSWRENRENLIFVLDYDVHTISFKTRYTKVIITLSM